MPPEPKQHVNPLLPAASNIVLQDYDKHIKGEPYEQVGAVVRIADAVRENPFPAFVNAVLLRLADAFRDGSNQLRLIIVRAVRECSSEFSLFSANEDVVRRVIKVSHSNDDKARALMLQFTSAIAPLVSDDKQLHHLLIESLESESNVELLATIVAVENFCIHSVEFSHLAIWKISEMLLESKHSPTLKGRLIRVLSNFHGDFKSVSKVFDLGQQLIMETSDRYNLAALISSMTRLAVKSRLAVERQLALLLSEMENSNGNQSHLCLLLLNIKVLADLSQFWTVKDAAKFTEMFEKYRPGNSNRVNAEWIGAFERLSTNCNVKILESIKEHFINWSYLLTLGNIDIRLCMMGLMENILLRIPIHSEHLITLLSSSFHSLFSSEGLTKNHYRKLFKLFDSYLHIPYILPDNVIIVSEQLTTSLIASNNFSFVVECLKKAANSHQSLQPHLKSWINRQLENPQLSSKNLCQLAELQFACGFADMDPSKWLDRNPEPDGWRTYKIARFALENGLWKGIASPLLYKLREKTESYETSLWIDALHYISESQVTTGTVYDLGQSCEKLMKAELNLRVLFSIPSRTKEFRFPLQFTTTLREFVSCAKTVIGVFTISTMNPAAQEEPAFREQFAAKV
uniref:Integrator complex subunit 7 n=1 Tax=Steinernema glaseri TaxID=37863 RepID=A0A1I8AHD8_9BILA